MYDNTDTDHAVRVYASRRGEHSDSMRASARYDQVWRRD